MRADPPSVTAAPTARQVVEYWPFMGNSQGGDNVKKRAARRKKRERLALAKKKQQKLAVIAGSVYRKPLTINADAKCKVTTE
jgi:hypothetical protein